jgi:gliding motility-associated-like protein
MCINWLLPNNHYRNVMQIKGIYRACGCEKFVFIEHYVIHSILIWQKCRALMSFKHKKCGAISRRSGSPYYFLGKSRFFLSFALCFASISSKSQVNLVPNPSFEILDSCAMHISSSIQRAVPWDTLKSKGGCGPFAVNTCCNTDPKCYSSSFFGVPYNYAGNNYQEPRSGKGYSVFGCFSPVPLTFTFSNQREYIQAPLINKLKKGTIYCGTFYIALGNMSKYALDELGAYFDDGTVSAPGRCKALSLTAQVKGPEGFYYADTLNWMKVQNSFVAGGTESYITLGYFKDQQGALNTALVVNTATNAGNSGYCWDDISVIELDLPAYAGRDTVLCTGDSVFIGRPPEIGLECLWFNHGSQIATGGGLWVKPATTQTYVVQQDVCGLIKRDTIQVQVKPKYTGTPGLTTNTLNVCPTDTLQFTVLNPPPGNAVKYSWEPAAAFTNTSNLAAEALIPQSTHFTLQISSNGEDAFCPFLRTNNVGVTVPLYTDTVIIVSNAMLVCPGDTIILKVQNPPPGNAVKYEWLPLSAFTGTSNLSAKALIQQGTTFTININTTVKDIFCPFTRSNNVTILVPDTCFKDPLIPNIFTPNNDNTNDEWKIKFPLGYQLNELSIYNRWGTLIFEINPSTLRQAQGSGPIQNLILIGWDGRTNSGQECSAGVYFYVLKYADRKQVMKMLKGNLTLMR